MMAMKSLIPGRFTSALVRTDAGELEARLSDGGLWQVKVRSTSEAEWRLLCVGHLDGRVLAPSPAEPQAPIKIGPLAFDFARRRVAVEGVDQPLRPREFDLLAMLASEPNRLFTKAELLREVWDYPEDVSTRTLETHVANTRRKLRQAGVHGFIVTYRGIGYKLCHGTDIESQSAAR